MMLAAALPMVASGLDVYGTRRGLVLVGDCRERLRELPDESVNCIVTSPPYWGLRDYNADGQMGLESSPSGFVDELVATFREARRVLRSDGTCWLNLGDTYAGAKSRDDIGGNVGATSSVAMRYHRTVDESRARAAAGSKGFGERRHGLKPKDLIGIPWRTALALQADGWWLRSDIIWAKTNGMPESVTDRPTRKHEYLFLLSKRSSYYYDADAIRLPRTREQRLADTENVGGNRGTVWQLPVTRYDGAHFATYPTELVEPCVLAGCPLGGLVLDPFAGSGTTLEVALRLGRRAIGIELNPDHARLIESRLADVQLPLLM